MATRSIALQSQIHDHLLAKALPPTQDWLNAFLSTQNHNVPIASLQKTALFRVLASDITRSIEKTSNTSVFPPNILNAKLEERMLAGPIPVQVLDIQDLCRSRWSRIEALEVAERGETTSGREVIRTVPDGEGLFDTQLESASGPYKVLLQDTNGMRVYGFELGAVEGVNAVMGIGTKLVLRNVPVARGVLLLGPENTTILGGKIDVLHKAWREDRKARLMNALEENESM